MHIMYIDTFIFHDTVNGPFLHISLPTGWPLKRFLAPGFFKLLHYRHFTVRLYVKTTAESLCSAQCSKDWERAVGTFAAG